MIFRKYEKSIDENKVLDLIKNQEGWDYANEEMADKYKTALENSITYVAYEEEILHGYSRSLEDCGIYIYVCDLLVRQDLRGNNTGRKLMECIYNDFPNHVVYVMSDVDNYYKRVGYNRVGSIFIVPREK